MINIEESEILAKGALARRAAYQLAQLESARKNEFLRALAKALISAQSKIIAENSCDLARGREAGTGSALLDRLALDEKRIAEIALSLEQVAELPDPIGETLAEWTRPNGLKLRKVRVPFGVIGIIYEARPNVTVDSAALCFKTGNACLLRGSSSAISTNKVLVDVIRSVLRQQELPADAVQLIEDTRRESIIDLLRANGLVDVVIPRGGAELINYVVQNSSVPVIETGAGNCHVFINHDADADMAIKICLNAKTQRPSVCNAAETVLVDGKWAERHLKDLIAELRAKGVECRGCDRSRRIAGGMTPAAESDWSTEYNDLILAVKVLDSVEQAIEHINTFGTRHTESIITNSSEDAARFMNGIDAAAVFHNASTRFTDGFEFGFGAEIGISTQKLHARGPMGLPELTSYKYLGEADGLTRA